MLLVHVCCGPCLTYPAEWLGEREIEFECFFFNPNIHPYVEFQKRLATFRKYVENEGIPSVVEEQYGLVEFLRRVVGKEQQRCEICYNWRFDAAAQKAKQAGCDAFTSTMLLSPYQDQEMMKSIAEEAATRHGVDFPYVDWRPGYRKSIQLSKAAELYRQRYCGCIYSEAEREGVL